MSHPCSRRLLLITAAAVLLLSVDAIAVHRLQPSPSAGQRLLAASTDLGPDRTGTVKLAVALHDSSKPTALIDWANAHELSARWHPGESWAYVEGTPTRMAQAFDVTIHNYRSRTGHLFYAATTQPLIPEPLRGTLDALGTLTSYHPARFSVPPTIPRDVPKPGLTPTQLRTTYNATPLRTTGKGQTVVFLEWMPPDPDDMKGYATKYNLPPIQPTLVGFSGSSQTDAESQTETGMDVEVVHAIAPNARLVVVDAGATIDQNGNGDWEELTKLFASIDRQFPGAVWTSSIGWGCDQGVAPADLASVQSALSAAEAHGTSAFDASGDTSGFECKGNQDWSDPPGQSDIGLDVIASLPAMTDVGGTTVSTDARGAWLAEETWVDVPMTQGTGGGVSAVFPRPPWQATVSSPADGTHRLTPDVAAGADPATGVHVLLAHEWQAGGGTSQSAPIWAGLAVLMNEYLLSHGGHALGDLNPQLYRIAAGAARPAFHDVALGGNGTHSAGVGYDLVTGLGTPDTNNLVLDILDLQRAGPR